MTAEQRGVLPPAPHPTKAPAMNARTVRMPDELWNKANERAHDDGLTISEVIRHYLTGYVEQDR